MISDSSKGPQDVLCTLGDADCVQAESGEKVITSRMSDEMRGQTERRHPWAPTAPLGERGRYPFADASIGQAVLASDDDAVL